MRTLKQLTLILMLTETLVAQNYVQSIPAEENRIVGSSRIASAENPKPHAFIGTTDQVFPHLATGGGWETIIVILNMSKARVDFTMHFYGQDGKPLPVTFRDYPNMNLTTTAAAVGYLAPNASFNFALFDATPDTRVGWASLEYSSASARLGGYAIFRQRVPGRPDFEAVVPLSAYDDTQFYMPFDNIQGFVTAMAVVNPASNLPSNLTITALDLSGALIGRTTLTLPPSGQRAFALTDLMPSLANRLGTLYVQSDITRMSGLGIRFNGSGGFAFSSVPILNWSGMF